MYTSVCYKDDYNTFKYHKYEDQNPDINMCTVNHHSLCWLDLETSISIPVKKKKRLNKKRWAEASKIYDIWKYVIIYIYKW